MGAGYAAVMARLSTDGGGGAADRVWRRDRIFEPRAGIAVKPILAQHCWSCHGPTRQKSGLRLDTAAAVVLGGNSGPAVVAGNSRSSRLIQAVTGARDVPHLPPFRNRPMGGLGPRVKQLEGTA